MLSAKEKKVKQRVTTTNPKQTKLWDEQETNKGRNKAD
jgi:hypothetical protein